MTEYKTIYNGNITSTWVLVSETDGSGYIELPNQGVAPTNPNDGIKIYAESSNLVFAGGQKITIDSALLTNARSYTIPDTDGTLFTNDSTTALTNKIISSATNITNGTSLRAISLSNTSPSNGQVIAFGDSVWKALDPTGVFDSLVAEIGRAHV